MLRTQGQRKAEPLGGWGRRSHAPGELLWKGVARWRKELWRGSGGGGHLSQARGLREAPIPLLGSCSKRWLTVAPALGGDMSICTNVYGKFVNLEKDRSSPMLGTRFGEQSWGWVMAPAGSLAQPLCARPILLNGSVMILAPGMFGRPCPGECGGAMSRPTTPSCHLLYPADPSVVQNPPGLSAHMSPSHL